MLTEWYKSSGFNITVMWGIQEVYCQQAHGKSEKKYIIQEVNLNEFYKLCLKYYLNPLSAKYNILKI
jgi:hypothetical protein